MRLDAALVERDLAASRERARALIMAGHVSVNDRPVNKAGTAVAEDARIEVAEPDHPYVSRGGVKLAHALDAFGVDPAGRRALDVGASTGGFTDVLLQRGAVSVIALDVGRAQLDWRLRSDARVTVVEGVNARSLTRTDVPIPSISPYHRRVVHRSATYFRRCRPCWPPGPTSSPSSSRSSKPAASRWASTAW
jgi:23S rRNA (cytidine1920-2'-O)/16S rRNA (cytidine1409-2'-O)-methyltransferase